MEYNEFINDLKGVNESRHHKINNSYGVYDGFKYYRKKRPKDKKFTLVESQYFSIIRDINNLLSEALIKGEDINLPERMGKIEIRKYKLEPKIGEDGKLVYKAPIDWDATLKLWYEDEESRNDKTLVKIISNESFRVIYNKSRAIYNNKSFYTLHINRELKKKISQAAKEGKIDAFTFKNKT